MKVVYAAINEEVDRKQYAQAVTCQIDLSQTSDEQLLNVQLELSDERVTAFNPDQNSDWCFLSKKTNDSLINGWNG